MNNIDTKILEMAILLLLKEKRQEVLFCKRIKNPFIMEGFFQNRR